MHADGIERAVAFTQYPQFSCSTTGSSLNELWRAASRTGLRAAFQWSVLDRWPVHPSFIEAMTETVRDGLDQFEPVDRQKVLLLFSAHSLPLDVIDRGDSYPQEVGASVQRVVERLGGSNPYILAYQSDVGPVRWLGPARRRCFAGSGPGTQTRTRDSHRVYQRSHRDVIRAGSGVWRGGTQAGSPITVERRP